MGFVDMRKEGPKEVVCVDVHSGFGFGGLFVPGVVGFWAERKEWAV